MHAHATRSDYPGLLTLGVGAVALGLVGRLVDIRWTGVVDVEDLAGDLLAPLMLATLALWPLKPEDPARAWSARDARAYVRMARGALVVAGVLIGMAFMRMALDALLGMKVAAERVATLIAFFGAMALWLRYALRRARLVVRDEGVGTNASGIDGAGEKA